MQLQDNVAIVTGAASGIGKEIAHAFAKEGAKVAIADINMDGANSVVSEIEAAGGTAMAVEMNVMDEAAVNAGVDAVAERFGRPPDILVNSAAIRSRIFPMNSSRRSSTSISAAPSF